MKVLRVSKEPPLRLEEATLEQNGIYTTHTSPTLLSAITALKIAKLADKHDIDIVTVNTQPDAMAAISARNIANTTFKLIYVAGPNTECPRTIHREVAEGVDGWLFSSQRLYDDYPSHLKNKATILPMAYSMPSVDMPDMSVRPLTLAWIGDITDTKRLKETIDAIDNAKTNAVLRISGAGKARDVMPAVRYARAMMHPERVVWLGEEYNKDREIAGCQAAIRTAKDITVVETEIMMTGRCVISPSEIVSYLIEPHAANIDDFAKPANIINQIKQYYLKVQES